MRYRISHKPESCDSGDRAKPRTSFEPRVSSLVLDWISITFRRRGCFSENKSLTRFTAKVKEFEGARGGTRMYYDLNVPYSANHGELQRTLAFLAERQSFSDPSPFLTENDL